MDILECVWKKDLSSDCEFFHKEELSYILEDKEDCLVGLLFMDDHQANHFFESVSDWHGSASSLQLAVDAS